MLGYIELSVSSNIEEVRCNWLAVQANFCNPLVLKIFIPCVWLNVQSKYQNSLMPDKRYLVQLICAGRLKTNENQDMQIGSFTIDMQFYSGNECGVFL